MENQDKGDVQSVKRALAIIDALSEHYEGLGVTQISKITGLSKTTAFRLLSTLINSGYVQKSIEESNYKLGMKFLKISSVILEHQDIRDLAKPYLKKLSDETKEIVHLAIKDSDMVVYIDKIERYEHSMRIFSTIGKHSPMHCTGLGKVFLSGLADDEVEKITAKKGLKKYTENTITNIEDLKKELAVVRARGHALDEMEHEIGIWCVSAPIFDRNSRMVAAISLTAPVIYTPEERKPYLISEAVSTAREISGQLGHV